MRRIKSQYKILLIAVIGLVAVIVLLWQMTKQTGEKGISVAMAARELSLVLSDKETILAVKETKFAVSERENWYVPYMDYLYAYGLMSEELTSAGRKGASKALTIGELRCMADGLGIWQSSSVWQENGLGQGSGLRDKQIVPKDAWVAFLTEARKRFDTEKEVQTARLSVYGTAANIHEIPAWNVMTPAGMYTFEGFSMDAYLDCQVEVWMRGAEIIRVVRSVGNTVTYENMLVSASEGTQLTVYFGGYTREFTLPEAVVLSENQVIDLSLSGGEVTGIRRKNDLLQGRIIAVEETHAEIEGYGVIPFSQTMQVYQTYGSRTVKSTSDVMIGYDIYDVIVAEGEICAIRIRQSPDARTIRVLLTDQGGSEKLHPAVTLTAEANFSAAVGQQTLSFQKGEQIVIDAHGIYRKVSASGELISVWTEVEAGQRITLKADGGKLAVPSFTRTFGTPLYPGTLEVLVSEGGVYLINETLIEDYLCGVVPAEMPANYHMEALRAQAISARGFAVMQLTSTGYRDIGAHVDDTDSFQVYNYSGTSERTDQAVRETYGQVLTLNDEIVTTYYFSTSCGYTSDVSLWGHDPENSSYLTSRRMSGTEMVENVQDEETFQAFIRNTELNDYECNYGWYRWNFAVSLEELTVIVNTNLAKLSAALKDRVLTKQADGSWKEGAKTVGSVESVSVLERGEGGVASLVEICGSEGTVRLLLQSAIREVLGSAEYVYDRIDGSEVTGRANLASAYFCLEPVYTDGVLTGYRFYGGGSGHGVGMPQNCANALGQSGITAEEMLKFFYVGTEVSVLYE